MGGGDLNMKKSWHPGLIKNRAQVWEDQNAALLERKRIETLKKEIEEERAKNELQRLNELNGGPKRQERVEFIYAGPGAGSSMAEDREAYLLGRKRIDDVLGKDSLGQGMGAKQSAPQNTGPNMRDVSNKVAQDPLLAIKRQEAAQYKAIIDRKKAELETEARKKARKAAQRPLRRDHDDDDDYRHSRRRDSDRDYYRRRSYSRDRRRDYSNDRRHDRRGDARDDHHRSARRSTRRHGSESPRSDEDYRESRRRSTYNDERKMSSTSRRHAQSRSPSPRRSRSRGHTHARAPLNNNSTDKDKNDVDDAQRRLAEMTESAKSLDDTRLRRLEESRSRDEEEQLREERGRARQAGLDPSFVKNMHMPKIMVE